MPAASPIDDVPAVSVDDVPAVSVDDVPAARPDDVPAAEIGMDNSIKVLPEDVIPVPKVVYKDNQSSNKKGRAKGATAIVTSSPYLKKLTLEEENNKLKEDVKNCSREIKALKKALKAKLKDKDTKDAPDDPKKRKAEVRRELFLGKGKAKKSKNVVLNIGNDEVPEVLSTIPSATTEEETWLKASLS